MTTLLVGFDSAWTPENKGGLVAALCIDGGPPKELGRPQAVDFPTAREKIVDWQQEHQPASTLVLIEQPTIVPNAKGQRPVENIVSSIIGRRRSGMQPSNKSRADMFGDAAPIWPFLEYFGRVPKLHQSVCDTQVIETYPALAITALGWTLADSRDCGRLPKYNPAQTKKFAACDWNHVCNNTARALRDFGLTESPSWIDELRNKVPLRKTDQDRLDACICLLVAFHLFTRRSSLIVGDSETGYIVFPDDPRLVSELHVRCRKTNQPEMRWARPYQAKSRV